MSRAPRRRRALFGTLLGALLVVIVLLLGAAGAAALLIDTAGLKPQIEAAVQRATGRGFVIRGPLAIRLFMPRLVAENAVLAGDGPGAPDLLRLGRLEARVALLPLLTGEVRIARLDLLRPDILLRTGMPPPEAVPPPAAASSPPAAAHWRPRLDIAAVHIADGRLTWQDARSGRSAVLGITRLDASSSGPDAAIVLSGELLSAGRTLRLTGETGSAARLLARSAAPVPWPVELVLQGDAARLAVRGSFARPLQGAGYALLVDAAATDLAAFAPLLPWPPPKLHDASLSARIGDSGHALPEIGGLTLHIGGMELPDLAIARADIAAPGGGEPARADIAGSVGGLPLHLRGSIGAAAVPVRIDLTADAAGAQLSVHGTAAAPGTFAGLALRIALQVPDLAPLSPLIGRPLPHWHALSFAGSVTGDARAGGTLALQGWTLTAPQAELAADVTLVLAAHPALRGTLAAQHLDLDAVLAALAPPAAAAPPSAAPAPTEPRTRLFSDQPIDLAPLRAADADLHITAATLQTGGVTYADVAGHLTLAGGALTLDPFAGTLPGGRLEARVAVDAGAAVTPMALRLHLPALALAPLAAALGHAGAIDGSGFVDADLTSAGTTPHALAAGLSGHLGLAVSDATADNAALAALLSGVMRAAKLPPGVLPPTGQTKLRCLAVLLEAKDGIADVATLAADSGKLLVQGGGDVALGAETIDLHLRPMLRIGPGLVVPVKLGGTLLMPKAGFDSGAAARAALLGAAPGDPCPPALAAARGEAPPPQQPVAAEPAKPPKPIDILRGLLSH